MPRGRDSSARHARRWPPARFGLSVRLATMKPSLHVAVWRSLASLNLAPHYWLWEVTGLRRVLTGHSSRTDARPTTRIGHVPK